MPRKAGEPKEQFSFRVTTATAGWLREKAKSVPVGTFLATKFEEQASSDKNKEQSG